jgi:hypothetical protein
MGRLARTQASGPTLPAPALSLLFLNKQTLVAAVRRSVLGQEET